MLAYHDRSDGGLFVTLCEMMFAGRTGVTVDGYGFLDADARRTLAALFNEELGAVIQVRSADLEAVTSACEKAGLAACVNVIGRPNAEDRLCLIADGREIYSAPRVELQRAWSETTFHMQRLRDHPECAQQEYDRILDVRDPGLHAKLAFDPEEDIAAPFIARGARPRIAILREQGVNGQMEMAAAFDRAGFAAVDVHMSDIIAGRVKLEGFAGFAACGGFSYGDVLGAGEGWAKSILFNARARDEFAAFFQRGGYLRPGRVQRLPDDEQPARAHTGRRALAAFRAQQVRAVRSAASRCWKSCRRLRSFWTAWREAACRSRSRTAKVMRNSQMRRRSSRPARSSRCATWTTTATRPRLYPYNPNGSPEGITGLTTPDGRHTIIMPHPERVFRTVQHSWHPEEWGEDGPWMRMFRNARKFVG